MPCFAIIQEETEEGRIDKIVGIVGWEYLSSCEDSNNFVGYNGPDNNPDWEEICNKRWKMDGKLNYRTVDIDEE